MLQKFEINQAKKAKEKEEKIDDFLDDGSSSDSTASSVTSGEEESSKSRATRSAGPVEVDITKEVNEPGPVETPWWNDMITDEEFEVRLSKLF